MRLFLAAATTIAASLLAVSTARSDLPQSIAVPDGQLIMTLHAQGAQIYECKADNSGNLAWQFREPIATLVADGKTVGRHYAGPNWELMDGSVVTGAVVGRAPGASANDIPLLKLAITSQRARGGLAVADTILRLNTSGGLVEGPCEKPSSMMSAPYSADYAFFAKAR